MKGCLQRETQKMPNVVPGPPPFATSDIALRPSASLNRSSSAHGGQQAGDGAGYDKTAKKWTFACSPRPLPPWGPRRLAGVHIPSLPTGAVRAAASASPVSPRRLHSWRSAVWAIWADVLVRSEDGLVTTLLLIRRVHLPSEPRPLLEQPPAGASRAPANTRLACLR